MIALLDTNAAIAVIKGTPPAVRERLRHAFAAGGTVALSAISLFELRYGVAKSARRRENADRLDVFLSGGIGVLPFEDADAESAGEIRAALEVAGTPIGPYDLLIAGQALRRNAILVTADTREFSRVPKLAVEDWSVPA